MTRSSGAAPISTVSFTGVSSSRVPDPDPAPALREAGDLRVSSVIAEPNGLGPGGEGLRRIRKNVEGGRQLDEEAAAAGAEGATGTGGTLSAAAVVPSESPRLLLSRALRNAMDDKGLSQAALAKSSGIGQATVSNALNGTSNTPSALTVEALAGALGITGEDLVALRRYRARAAKPTFAGQPGRPPVPTEAGGQAAETGGSATEARLEGEPRRSGLPAADPPHHAGDSGHPPCSPCLRRYLAAATTAAEAHPYPGVLPGVEPPPLSTVYLRQQARPQTLVDGSSGAGAGLMDADTVLGGDGSCLILAGPGAGKSSLLRTGLLASVDHWSAGLRERGLAVLVKAADLVDQVTLPEAIARSVTAELSDHGLLEALPPEFFRTHPAPGLSWQVLVDGLDEIADASSRRRVLTMIGEVHRKQQEGLKKQHELKGQPAVRPLYRFVVATRPLPRDEMVGAAFREDVLALQLEPFAPADLHRFATGWFEKLSLSPPGRAADAFIEALERTQLAEQARTPLMATMLCQLYAADPGRRLPIGRSGLYQRFIDLLYERQHAAGNSGVRVQARAALCRYGEEAVSQAEYTLDRLTDMIAGVAADLRRGSHGSVLGLLAGHPDAARPKQVPHEVWERFLDQSLRRSGLLTPRAGDLVFLHQTLLEYLAVRHDTRDRAACRRAVRGAFGSPLLWWLRRHWAFRDEYSFLGFLMDAAEGNGFITARALRRMAKSPTGARFMAAQAALGTQISGAVSRIAADTIVAAITDPRLIDSRLDRDLAAEKYLGDIALLVDLGDGARAADLAAILADEGDVFPGYLVDAACVMADLGDRRAPDVLLALARGYPDGPARISTFRLDAALKLHDLGDPRAAELLASFAANPRVQKRDRIHCAQRLAASGGPRAAGHLDAPAGEQEPK
ncbi:helix-turn-helix domain-containing protein [Streptomyces sp. NPDC005727]|uniref:helix-turn-helix domain-containing protein n=1 Tax=Streptomyces sp. NPDC005727 TaxID=3157053 RepID=UPI0033C32097